MESIPHSRIAELRALGQRVQVRHSSGRWAYVYGSIYRDDEMLDVTVGDRVVKAMSGPVCRLEVEGGFQELDAAGVMETVSNLRWLRDDCRFGLCEPNCDHS